MRWLAALALGAAVAGAAYWRRALTLDGAIAAAVVGAIVFARGGVRGAATLLTFFVSSSALSRGNGQVKGAQRDAWQVLANGLAPAVSLALGNWGGFAGGIAAAAADTWATEIGMRARWAPRLITSGRVVESGMSGGVTVPGLVASVCGAVLVGAVAGELQRGVVAGVVGSLFDSVLGATVQALYRCDACGQLTELRTHHEQDAVRVRGLGWVNNDVVNLLATATGTLVGGQRSRRLNT